MKNTYKAVLYDASGVLLKIGSDPFTVLYAQERGFDPKSIEPFFDSEFRKVHVGKADLKELLEKHRDIWQWNGDVEELMHLWFTSEDVPETNLIDTILELKKNGVLAYIATNNERHRSIFIHEELLPGVFDGVFSSGMIGAMKPSAEFFQHALDELTTQGIKKEEIVFFDDSQSNVQGAKDFGIDAYLYKDVHQVRELFSLPPLSK